MTSIRFDAVWKRYDTATAVENLHLACAEGEMLALLGPSGCGKSSTLKMLAGIETVSQGEIYFGDRPISRLASGARNIAMVFEDYALYPHLTVRENLNFPLSVRGMARADAARRVDDALTLLGLENLADRGVRALSGGAQQRVSIGRALVRDPDVILFDEPLSHLDADQKVQLRTEIKRLQKISAVTSILVTHDQTEATAMADRIAVMNHGVLQQVGTPDELYSRPANLFVANFIGEPPMNLLPARIAQSGRALAIDGMGWLVPLAAHQRDLAAAAGRDGAPLILGVRPEHVAVDPAGDGIAARLQYREPHGDTDILTMSIGDAAPAVVAEVEGPCHHRAGDSVSLKVSPEHLHLFDPVTTRNLAVPA